MSLVMHFVRSIGALRRYPANIASSMNGGRGAVAELNHGWIAAESD